MSRVTHRSRSRSLRRAGWRILSLAVVLLSSAARAGDWKTLVMPGPVIAGHAKIEADCASCHQALRAEAQRELCVDCHKAVGADLESQRGYHGRLTDVDRVACRDCHTEHKGREADVLGLDRDAFDHRKTDFSLRGAHASLTCERCHAAGQRFSEAASACIGCHRDDDPHRQGLGEACGDCHQETSWNRARFEHAATAFPLKGSHAQVQCAACHVNERYKKTPTSCASCHGIDDSHRGRLGAACGDCHDSVSWKKTRFDHGSKTRFPLTGAHRELACRSCHRQDAFDEKLPLECGTCHRLDDDHRGRNGPRCGDCHTSQSWKSSRFQHDRKTRFPLRGLHGEVRCDACHKGTLGKERISMNCYSCHRADDAHEGQEGRDCAGCHDERGWADQVSFDHGLTKFPLLGLHALVSCEDCHRSQRFADADPNCSSCHATDDHHETRLGDDCGRCHVPNSWRVWSFDHDTQTSFSLHGAHEGLACRACHSEPTRGRVQQSRRCETCHTEDDVHRGSFGRSCGQCHVDTSWRELRSMR